jgi:hypothetical protein
MLPIQAAAEAQIVRALPGLLSGFFGAQRFDVLLVVAVVRDDLGALGCVVHCLLLI